MQPKGASPLLSLHRGSPMMAVSGARTPGAKAAAIRYTNRHCRASLAVFMVGENACRRHK